MEGLIGGDPQNTHVTKTEEAMLLARGKLKRPVSPSNWRAQVDEELMAAVLKDQEALKKQKPQDDVKGDPIPF